VGRGMLMVVVVLLAEDGDSKGEYGGRRGEVIGDWGMEVRMSADL